MCLGPGVNQEQDAGGREGPHFQSLAFRSSEKPLKGFQQDGNNMGFMLKGGCVEGCLEGGTSTALGSHTAAGTEVGQPSWGAVWQVLES